MGGERAGALLWAGAIVLVAAVAAATAAAVLSTGDGVGPSRGPTLRGASTLREAAEPDAAPIANVSAGAPVSIEARTESGDWLMVRVTGRADIVGWVNATAVADTGDLSAVPVVRRPDLGASPPLPTAPATVGSPNVTPDLPDLRIAAVFSRDNRLVVVVTNDGAGDAAGPILVAVGEGEPRHVDVGKPLRPGDELEVVLVDEYVERRAAITVRVTTSAEEADDTNNDRTVTVGPDVPNDLEVRPPTVEPVLTVTLINNSVIPLVGSVILVVRERQPGDALLGRLDAALAIEAGGTQSFAFPALVGLDRDRIRVLLESDTINDANPSNDVYPR